MRHVKCGNVYCSCRYIHVEDNSNITFRSEPSFSLCGHPIPRFTTILHGLDITSKLSVITVKSVDRTGEERTDELDAKQNDSTRAWAQVTAGEQGRGSAQALTEHPRAGPARIPPLLPVPTPLSLRTGLGRPAGKWKGPGHPADAALAPLALAAVSPGSHGECRSLSAPGRGAGETCSWRRSFQPPRPPVAPRFPRPTSSSILRAAPHP